MYVEDVFSISGRGTVVTGKVERGTINKGAEVEIVGMGNSIKTTLTGIGECPLYILVFPSFSVGGSIANATSEMFHKELDRGEAGDNMGALLRGIKREQVRRGQVLVAPNSIKSFKKFKAQIYVSGFQPLFALSLWHWPV